MKHTSEQKPRRTFAVLIFCISILSTDAVLSQVNRLDEKKLEETMRNPWKLDNSVFLTDWLILGSFPIGGMEEIDKDFLADNSGEANVRPAEGQVVKISGSEMQWTPVKSKDIVDLRKFFEGGRTEDAIAYAYTTVNRKEAGKVYFSLASDDGVKVWLNGKLVHRVARLRAVNLDEDRLELNMNAGDNHLLLKIQQGKGGWGFAVRMFENPSQLNIITGNIEFSLTDINPKEKTLTVFSEGNLNQALLRQTVEMEVYTTGGTPVAKKTFNCSEPVVLNYQSWPDGVFEFRFVYKDIRGAKFVKYTSWYKGDILAAAREIVNRAPDKSVRTPEAATERMLADIILDRLGNNLQNPDSSKLATLHLPLIEFDEMKAGKQIRRGGFVRLAYIDDIDNTPQFCRCYLPLNYDPSKKWPMVVYLHGYYENNPAYINLWDVNKRHESASDKQDVIFIEPHGRGNTQYLGIGDLDVLKCIEMAKQKLSVNDERVYLMGSSMGGFGTWNVATRHPELFAAMAPIYGGGDYHVFMSKEKAAKLSTWDEFLNDKSSSTAQMESLLNMPILVSHGDQDQSVDVNLSRYVVRLLQRWNYDVRYIEVPGKGHTDLGLWDQIISWLLQHKRNTAPRQVRVRAADLRTASAYWIEVTQKTSPFEFMVVDAEVLEGNIIRVDSRNVCELSLTPDESLIDYGKPVNVVWNGRSILASTLKAKKIVLKGEEYTPLSSRKTPRIAGPIADFQNTPFVIVIGTISNDPMMKKAIAQKAEMTISGWKSFQKYEPRFMNDVDVTEADLKNYSLFLLGGPEENAASKRIVDKSPFRVKSDDIVIDGRSFKAKDAVLHAVYPNPYNHERYINIVAATSGAGFCFFDPLRNDLFQYDYYVADGKFPNFSAGAKNEKILVASGFFNYNWKIDEASLNKGDEDLRSKCAYTVVNNDLTTKIISFTKPSIELLRSYVGTYQVEGGPQVKIFLENDTLRAAQGPNNVRLQAISDNEFYVKEINGSVSFRKQEAERDSVMIVYQSGQEFTCKKVK
jgi:pimeloyl-ACP methyl ester carboxylesterase